MGFFSIDKGVFFDEGIQAGIKFIPSIFFKKKFNYNNRSYIVDLTVRNENGYLLSFKKKGWIWNTVYTFYDVNNPFPLRIQENIKSPQVDTEFLNIQLENKVARDLNRLSDSRFKEFLTVKNILIGSAILIALYLFFSGQYRSLFGI